MSRPLPRDFDVDYELTRLVRRVRMSSMGRLTEIHPTLDYNAFLLFIAVADEPKGVRASDLAETLHVHKSTVSRAVTALEKMELVQREADPDDGRAQVLTIPADARARLDAFRGRSHAWLASLLEDWDPQELTSFAKQLARLNDTAETKAR